MISIRMIKPCGISIYKPLQTIFQNCLYSGKFPSERKKANVVPTFKKGDKQCIKNCRPVSLLPVCGKGSSHSTYAQKLPKLDPPPPLYAIVSIWLDTPLCVRTVYIFFCTKKGKY